MQFVENYRPAIQKHAPVLRRLDALAAAIEETHPERMLQFRDRSGDGGLSAVEAFRRLSHAAGLHDGHENVQLVQLKAASDAVTPLHARYIPVLLSPDQIIALCDHHGFPYLGRQGSRTA